MSENLIAFLNARLDEDEQWALAASKPYPHATDNPPIPAEGLHWQWGVGPNWEPAELNPATQEFVGDEEGARCTLISVEEWPTGNSYTLPRRYATVEEMDVSAAGHIIRHDPARVLREVEAKRRLLEQFRLRGDSVRTVVQPTTGGVWDDLLLLLALPYADHDDYREEWRP